MKSMKQEDEHVLFVSNLMMLSVMMRIIRKKGHDGLWTSNLEERGHPEDAKVC